MAIHTNRTLLTQQEAAKALGVGVRRITDLRRAGDLDSLHGEAGRYLIVADSVRRYALVAGRGGRPYSPQMAFAALYLISGEPVPWLDAQRRYRLKRYLRETETADLVRLTRRRAQTREYWCRDSLMDKVRESIRISGATGRLADLFHLAPGTIVEGYADVPTAKQVIHDCRLRLGGEPTGVRLRTAVALPAHDGNDGSPAMPLGVCAADLAESDDPRERRAGVETLGRLLAAFKDESR
ncbi:MAG: helix-turn-helix domain-containing protein [Bifidobacterium mongoliense]|jgi:hypothetical protein|uniref:helix-turn-helix domain-containing protein n=1 Tax=Bifidobacterium mongoliense TaxID=518643 RepID=UPI002F355056